ncbi:MULTISPECIES: hypothetical protein [Streptomyces]|uniref:hypothetical protein n=1 Tax=Streptomyces TaxID=1883 RepID=UPI00278BCF1C|nr:hypothetical protein [Streptomyces hydrogenans]
MSTSHVDADRHPGRPGHPADRTHRDGGGRRLAADGPGEVAARRPVRLYVPFLRTVLDTDPLRAA